MEEVQRDKHERLLRALDCSGAEESRLLSARQRGALGRLATSRRDAERRRKKELREKLASIKGNVARLWREHNRSCCVGHVSSGGGADSSAAVVSDGRPVVAAGGSLPSLSVQVDGTKPPMPSSGKCEDEEVRREARQEDGVSFVDVKPDFPGGQRSSPSNTSGKRKVKADAQMPAVPTSGGKNQLEGTKDKPPPSSSPSKPFSHTRRRRGGARWRGKRAAATSAADTSAADGAAGWALDALTEEEIDALATLGRGAPSDPRLLLMTSPLSPARQRRQRQQLRPGSSSSARSGGPDEVSESRPQTWVEGRSTSGGVHSDDGAAGVSAANRNIADTGKSRSIAGRKPEDHADEVLARAVDKLSRKIQIQEELSRRRLGLSPSPRSAVVCRAVVGDKEGGLLRVSG